MRRVVADAGFDSEANLRLAERDLNVRAIVPRGPGGRRPGRRRRRCGPTWRGGCGATPRDGCTGSVGRFETAISMIKRNLGSALRARTTIRRKHELLLRVLTHNVMLLAEG